MSCVHNDRRAEAWGSVCNICHPAPNALPPVILTKCPDCTRLFDYPYDQRSHAAKVHR